MNITMSFDELMKHLSDDDPTAACPACGELIDVREFQLGNGDTTDFECAECGASLRLGVVTITHYQLERNPDAACPRCGKPLLFSSMVRSIECGDCGWAGQSLSDVRRARSLAADSDPIRQGHA